jgi:hypothetical protein
MNWLIGAGVFPSREKDDSLGLAGVKLAVENFVENKAGPLNRLTGH